MDFDIMYRLENPYFNKYISWIYIQQTIAFSTINYYSFSYVKGIKWNGLKRLINLMKKEQCVES